MTRVAALLLTALVLEPGGASPAHQVPARDTTVTTTFGTASISGVVINDANPAQPVRRAIVTVTGGGLVPSRSAITDDAGRFAIGNLPEGRFNLGVSRSGFITSNYGAKRPGRPGTAVVVNDGAQIEQLVVRIWRGAAIGGVLRDDTGVPVQDIPVYVVPARSLGGVSPTLSNNGTTTDDLGQFRIFGLQPGTYAVVARPGGAGGAPMTALSEAEVDAAFAELRSRTTRTPARRPEVPRPSTFTYAPVYYPGTLFLAQTEPITLAAGQEAVGLDFALTRVSTAVVEGVVTRPDGLSAAGTAVQLQLAAVTSADRFTAGDPVMLNATAGSDGRFRISQVAPGDYRLIARAPAQPPTAQQTGGGGRLVSTGPAGPQLWATAPVSMAGSNVTGLVLALQPGASFSGRIQFAGTEPAPSTGLNQLRAGFMPTEGIAASGVIRTLAFVSPVQVRPDGTFELEGIPPGRFRFTIFGNALNNTDWVLHSAIVASSDLLDGIVEIGTGAAPAEIVVTYTDAPAELSGTLQTTSGAPASDVFVIAYATDRTAWGPSARRVRAVRPDVDGRYVIKGLPAGDYFLSAVTDVDQDEWQDPAFLAELIPASIKLTIADGEKRVQDLRLGGG